MYKDGGIYCRDSRGWLLPAAGTNTRKVYDLLIEGLGSGEIAERLKLPHKYVYVRVHRIKYAKVAGKGPRTSGRGCRDQRGWLIPVEGSNRRAVYDQMVKGYTAHQIMHNLNITKKMVSRDMSVIKNAKRANVKIQTGLCTARDQEKERP